MRLSMLAATAAIVSVIALPLSAQQTTRPVYTPGALTPDQQTAHDIYRQLIEINSGDVTGSVTPAAQVAANAFRQAGYPDSDIFVGGPRPEKYNTVLRIHGRDKSRTPLLLLAHIDVVEAKKADWSADLDPFVFTERDGYYYGRGTSDDKAMASIFIANALRWKREGWVPDRDVIIALTADEENGTANGVDWLLRTHPELVNAGVVINEGGGGVLRDGKPLFNTVQSSEKVYQDFTLRVTNRGGHSSVPRDDNAITSLADALSRVGRYKFPVRLNDITREFFTRTAALETPATGRAMRAIVANINDSAAVAVLAADPRYNSMLRTTCVATMLRGGHAPNALPQLAEANVNCRIFPGQSIQSVQDQLARVVNDTSVHVETVAGSSVATAPSPLMPELFGPVQRITREMWGNIPVIPTMSTGATDSKFFRDRGVPAYGVSGLFLDPTVDSRAHGRDERMRVQSFYEGQEFLYRLAKALASPAITP
jgi:acetylornithine deacetylase/succinyl-diaminopimelate desuccinylase-like protein